MNRRFSSLAILALFVTATLTLGAYQRAGAAGGAISGAVVFKGTAPKAEEAQGHQGQAAL